MGFKADVIIWLFEGRQLYCRLTLHRVKVQAVAFSPSDKYLATLGGSDDNRLVMSCENTTIPILHNTRWAKKNKAN